MQPHLLLVACLLVLPVLPGKAGAVPVQAIASGRPDEASADTLSITLSEAQRLALSLNQELLAERREIDVARGLLTQSRVLAPNPELELKAPGAWWDGGFGEFEVSLTQELEVAGQRRHRIRAATSGLLRSEAMVDDAVRRTLAAVSHAFFTALAAQERLAVVIELADLNRRLVEAARIQAREGEISVMDANLAEIEAGRARTRRLTAEREAIAARLGLQQLIGIPPGKEIRLTADPARFAEPSNLDPDALLSLALNGRPDLAAADRAMEEADARAALARREAVPNPRIGVFIEREERLMTAAEAPGLQTGLEPARIGAAVSLPLPLFQRNQGIVAETRARSEQAGFNRDATELAVRADVIGALDAYLFAREEIRILETEAILPARENQRLLDIAFEEGRIPLSTLLLLRNQLLDAELGYWDAWLAARLALVELLSATATLGVETSPDDPGDPR